MTIYLTFWGVMALQHISGHFERSHHYDNTSMQYTAIFHGCKNNNFQMIFFDSVYRPFQDYFIHIETSQSVGGETGVSPGKPPDTPASRTWLVSHVASAGMKNCDIFLKKIIYTPVKLKFTI